MYLQLSACVSIFLISFIFYARLLTLYAQVFRLSLRLGFAAVSGIAAAFFITLAQRISGILTSNDAGGSGAAGVYHGRYRGWNR
jgi:hypothetical protein